MSTSAQIQTITVLDRLPPFKVYSVVLAYCSSILYQFLLYLLLVQAKAHIMQFKPSLN
jgi:hypothetical protein